MRWYWSPLRVSVSSLGTYNEIPSVSYMFAITQYFTSNVYAVIIGVVVYSLVYGYFLMFNDSLLPVFTKFIPYILVTDLLVAFFITYTREKASTSKVGTEDAIVVEDILSDSSSESSDSEVEKFTVKKGKAVKRDVTVEDDVVEGTVEDLVDVAPVKPTRGRGRGRGRGTSRGRASSKLGRTTEIKEVVDTSENVSDHSEVSE